MLRAQIKTNHEYCNQNAKKYECRSVDEIAGDRVTYTVTYGTQYRYNRQYICTLDVFAKWAKREITKGSEE